MTRLHIADIPDSIKSNRKQFYKVNLTKTWLGNFLGDFSLSLGDFLTETSGHPGQNKGMTMYNATEVNLDQKKCFEEQKCIFEYNRKDKTISS